MPYKDRGFQIERQKQRLEELKKDPEKWAEFQRKKNERQRQWRDKNRDKVNDYKKLNKERHPETIKEGQKRRYQRYYYKHQVEILEQAKLPEKMSKRRVYLRNYTKDRRARDEQFRQRQQYQAKKWKNNLDDEGRRHFNERNARTSKEWLKRNPDKRKEYYLTAKEKWTNGINCLDPAIWKTAELKVVELAKQLGYTDIFKSDFVGFYFDFAARKDGQIAVFQVTTLRNRAIKRKHIELASYFGLKYFIVHVKPTLDIAFVSEISTNPVPDRNAVGYSYSNGVAYSL